MVIPVKSYSAEIIEKRSRFIGNAELCTAPEQAKELVQRRRDEYPDSTHVVYAFITGPENSQTFGMSDDGEPKGTAGRPVLEVLKGSGISNILLTVVRYFGGTKLGTGGLVRAYTNAAKAVLTGLQTKRFVETCVFSAELPYDLFEPAKRVFGKYSAVLSREDFTSVVYVEGEVPLENLQQMRKDLLDISSGSLQISTE